MTVYGYIMLSLYMAIYKRILQWTLGAQELRDFQKALLTDHKTHENHATVHKNDLSALPGP